MQDYAAAFTNFSGAFPDIQAVNASGPSATDGTEFIANMINDSMWGVWQMILNRAGMTPNGVLESDSASQIREALQKGFGGAPGTIQEWNLASDPGTTGHRCLLLNGQGILRANYPDLDSACYVGDGNNAAVAAAGGAWFRADNSDGSSPNIAGVYLILPEGRGVTVRGLDAAATIDPDGASRYIGDLQEDAFQGHLHNMHRGTNVLTAGTAFFATVSTTLNLTGVTEVPFTDGVNGTPRTESESRMYNRSTKFVVWY